MEDETPRSIGYGSPRDDRFSTPRATVVRSNSNSNSDEWVTPRNNHHIISNMYNSDNEFVTPRTIAEIAEMKPSSGRKSNGFNKLQPYDEKLHGNNQSSGYSASPKPPLPSSTASSKRNSMDQKQSAVHELEETENPKGVINEREIEELFSYARHGRLEEMEKLLNKGIPVDVRNGNKRVAKAVLRRGANINCKNLKGNTPLHYCYHYGYGDTLGQYIISKGGDPDARNLAGKSTWEGI